MTAIAARNVFRCMLLRPMQIRMHSIASTIPQSIRGASCETGKFHHCLNMNMTSRHFSKDQKEEEESISIEHIRVPEEFDDEFKKPEVNDKQDEIADIEEYTEEVTVELPDLGEVKGRIQKWYKKEGDYINPNDTICDIETDLFTFGMDVEDQNGGILKEILVKEGEGDVDPGTPICTLLHKP